MRSLLFTSILLLLLGNTLHGQLQTGDRIMTITNGSTFSPELLNLPASSNLASAITATDLEGLILIGNLQYGFMVSDQLLIGSSVALAGGLFDGGNTNLGIIPYGRFYFKNDPRLMLFGGLGTGLLFNFSEFGNETSFILTPGIGASLPIANHLLLTPRLNYSINTGPNNFAFGLEFEFILGKNNAMPGAQSTFGAGSFLIGADGGQISFGGDQVATNVGFSPNAHYFFTDRLAAGFGVSIANTSFSNLFLDFSRTTTFIEVDGRYYFSTDQHFTPFAQVGLVYLNQSFSLRQTGAGESSGEFGFDFSVGSNLWIRDNLALEIGVSARTYPELEGTIFSTSLGGVFVLGGR